MEIQMGKKAQQNKNSGFTLIELIVVIVIIGILAAILVAAFRTLPDKAKDRANLATARTIYSTAAISEAQTPGVKRSVAMLVADEFLESDPGDDFSITYDPIVVSYPTADGVGATYPE